MSDPENGHSAMEGTPPPPKGVIVLSLNHDMTVGVTFPNGHSIDDSHWPCLLVPQPSARSERWRKEMARAWKRQTAVPA